MPSTSAWVDTGLVVALFARDDPFTSRRSSFSRAPSASSSTRSGWSSPKPPSGPIHFHEITVADLPGIRATLKRYQNLSPDFTDAALVTLAGALGIHAIATVDLRDFSAYRLPGGAAFERLWL